MELSNQVQLGDLCGVSIKGFSYAQIFDDIPERIIIVFESEGLTADAIIKKFHGGNYYVDERDLKRLNIQKHFDGTHDFYKAVFISGPEITVKMCPNGEELTEAKIFDFAEMQGLLPATFEMGIYLAGILTPEVMTKKKIENAMIMHTELVDPLGKFLFFTEIRNTKLHGAKLGSYSVSNGYPKKFHYVFIDPNI